MFTTSWPPSANQSNRPTMPHALQCPRCNGAVSVPDHAAGQRVKCPHCEESFLAPGFSATKNDDDDWLTLDSDPVFDPPETSKAAAPDVADSAPTPGSTGEKRGSKLSAEDEALLTEFSSDLDEFTAEIEAPPPPLDEVEVFKNLPPIAPAVSSPRPVNAPTPVNPPGPRPPATPAAQPVEYESEYRVKCSICGSILYAKAAQAGKTLTCSDCHSPIKIPPPPRKQKKAEIDIANAETFSLEQSVQKERRDPFQRSADELLAAASRREEEKSGPTYDDVPSIKEWAKNVFGIFLDPGVVVHWLGLSVMASVPAFAALSFDSPMLILGLFPAGFFLGAIVVSCGFAILQSVANEEKTVSEWPVFDPMGWIGQLFVAVAAALVAAVPAWAVATLVFQSSLTSAAITMLSVYAIFPFVVLSMLDMGSPFVPFSAEVARSVTKCEEAWGGFYFSSGVLFVGLFLVFAVTSTMSAPLGAVVAIFATIAIAFVYFSMIGRLAYAIGQTVNAPPMKNDIDRQQHARPRDGSLH